LKIAGLGNFKLPPFGQFFISFFRMVFVVFKSDERSQFLIRAFLLVLPLLAGNGGLAEQSSKAAVASNDSGVRALEKGDYQTAVQNLKLAIAGMPGHKRFQQNLATAYNNWGLSLKNDPNAAIAQFHMAYFIDPTRPVVKDNLDGIIRRLHKDPQSFSDRVELAQVAKKSGDTIGAIVEYNAALAVRDDATVSNELKSLQSALTPEQKQLQIAQSVASDATSGDRPAPPSDLPASSFAKASTNGQSTTTSSDSNELEQYYRCLAQLEQQLLGKTYEDLIPQRLARLENAAFGAGQSGSIRKRLDALVIKSSELPGQKTPSTMTGNTKDSSMGDGTAGSGVDSSSSASPLKSDRLESLWSRRVSGHAPLDTVLISFKLKSDGSIYDTTADQPRIAGTCKDSAIDNLAMDMVSTASPFSFYDSAKPDQYYDALFCISKKTVVVTSRPLINYQQYMAEIQRRIRHCWHPPKGTESRHVTVVFKVLRDGTMVNSRILKSSELPACDDAALAALKEANPADPLPSGSPDVDIKFTFDYNVHKGARPPAH